MGGHFSCADMIDKTFTFHLIPNLSHLEHIEHCYKVIIAKAKFLAAQLFGISIFRIPLEKSCQSVVSPYIFTISILFLIVDTLRVQKNIVLQGCGGGGAWWTPLAHGLYDLG